MMNVPVTVCAWNGELILSPLEHQIRLYTSFRLLSFFAETSDTPQLFLGIFLTFKERESIIT